MDFLTTIRRSSDTIFGALSFGHQANYRQGLFHRILLTLSCLFVFSTPTGFVYAGDTALVLYINGKHADKYDQKIVAFSKLAIGNKIELEANSQIKILYQRSGNMETWQGPAKFEVAQGSSLSIRNKPTARTKVSKTVIQYFQRAPQTIKTVSRVKAMTTVRDVTGLDIDDDIVKEIKKYVDVYKNLRLSSDEKDISPELFLISALNNLGAISNYVDILLDEMKRRNPEEYKKIMNKQ